MSKKNVLKYFSFSFLSILVEWSNGIIIAYADDTDIYSSAPNIGLVI